MKSAAPAQAPATAPDTVPGVKFDTVALSRDGIPTTVTLAWRPGVVERHPAILMMGEIRPGELPPWSRALVRDGFMLAAFASGYPPDPDPARRPVWLYFDQRFAHSYALGAVRAPADASHVMDYLDSRGDVVKGQFGWMGSSTTGIFGLAVAVHDKRIAAFVGFVCTGAYRKWFESWHTNELWRGETPDLWPETLEILDKHDPILFADKLYPTAALFVCGGEDKAVDVACTKPFVDAARPAYESDPERIRFVIYEGMGHNLPLDCVEMYTNHWFRRYLPGARAGGEIGEGKPASTKLAATLDEQVRRTQINAGSHQQMIGAKPQAEPAAPAPESKKPESAAIKTEPGQTSSQERRAAMITVKSPAFEPGKPIPKKHTKEGADASPVLSWSQAPEGTKEFALICDDPDAPRKDPWVHWVVWGIPGDRTSLPEGGMPGLVEGKNDFGDPGYGGPMPPRGHGVHRYYFKLYALDAPLTLKAGATKADLLRAMDKHILAQGELMGTYERK